MSIKGEIKEGTGYIKEEYNEMREKNASNQADKAKFAQNAQEARNERNEGRIEDGKAPKLTTPGHGKKEEK